MQTGRALLLVLLLWSGAAGANDFRTLPDYMKAMAALGTPLASSAYRFFSIEHLFDIERCAPSISRSEPVREEHLLHLRASQEYTRFMRRTIFPLGITFSPHAALGGSLPEYSRNLLQAVETVIPHVLRHEELVRWYARTRDMRNAFAAASCRDAIEIQGAFIHAYDEYRQRLDTYRKWIELLMAIATDRPRYRDMTDLVPTEFTRIPQEVIVRAALRGFSSPHASAVNHRQALAQSRGQLLIRIHPDTFLLNVILMASDLAAVEIPFALRKAENSGEFDLSEGQFTVYYFERHTDVILTFDEIPRLTSFARRFGEVWRQSLARRN